MEGEGEREGGSGRTVRRADNRWNGNGINVFPHYGRTGEGESGRTRTDGPWDLGESERTSKGSSMVESFLAMVGCGQAGWRAEERQAGGGMVVLLIDPASQPLLSSLLSWLALGLHHRLQLATAGTATVQSRESPRSAMKATSFALNILQSQNLQSFDKRVRFGSRFVTDASARREWSGAFFPARPSYPHPHALARPSFLRRLQPNGETSILAD